MSDAPPRRGPRPKGRTERLMVYLTPEEKLRLEVLCAVRNLSQAQAVRFGLRLLEKLKWPDA